MNSDFGGFTAIRGSLFEADVRVQATESLRAGLRRE